MNYKLGKKVLFFLFLIFCFNSTFAIDNELNILYPNYFGENDNVFEDIHYLKNELLSFEVCSDGDIDLNITLFCSDGETLRLNPIKNEETKNACYFSNYNLNDLNCDEFELEVRYVQEGREKIITRNFVEQKESKVLNQVLDKDYSTLSALDLSYYLLLLNLIQDYDSQEKTDIYDMLKNLRDNTNKCWPKNDCDSLTTSKILNNLDLAGYSSDSRLIDDGIIYLKEKVILDEDIDYLTTTNILDSYEFEIRIEHEFSTNEEIDCDLDIDDGETTRSYTFDENSDLDELRIYNDAEDNIDFSCDSNVDNIYLKTYEESITSDYITNDDQFDYQISQADINDFDEFNLEILINHSFGVNEEIDCDLDIDDGETTRSYTFDENSDLDEFLIEEEITEEFDFDCDGNFDQMYYIIYGGEVTEEEFSNDDEFNSDIDTQEEEKFNFIFYLDYDFSDSDEELSCTLTYDSRTKNLVFDEDDLSSGKIKIDKYYASNNIGISCDKTLDLIEYEVYDKLNRKQISEEVEEKVSVAYNIPSDFSEYSCFAESSNSCDYETTLYTSNILQNSYDSYSEVTNYIDSFKVEDSNERYFIDSSEKYLDSGKYIYFKRDQDILDSLKFTQNNDGSWGSGSVSEKILETSWVTIGLKENDANSEHVEDAKKWIYYNEPLGSWGSIEKNSLAFLAIKEDIKPYIKLDSLEKISKNIDFSLENPTIYLLENVELDFSPEIKNYLSYTQSIGDLNPNEKVNVNITVKDSFSGRESGYLILSGYNNKKEIELIQIPIIIEASFPFEIENTQIKIIEGEIYTKIPLKAKAQEFSLSCTVKNPFENRDETFTITPDTTQIQISNLLNKVGEYEIEFNCNSESGNMIQTETINVELIPKNFALSEENILISNQEEFSVELTNLGEEILNIDMEVTGDYVGIVVPAEPSKILAFNETRDIYFQITNLDLLQTLDVNSEGGVLISSGDYSKELKIIYSAEVEEESNNMVWVWIIILVLVVLFSLVILIRYNRMKNQEDDEGEDSNDEEELFLDDDMEFH